MEEGKDGLLAGLLRSKSMRGDSRSSVNAGLVAFDSRVAVAFGKLGRGD